MNEIMKFDGTAIDIQKIDGAWMFDLYAVGMALGQVKKNGRGVAYPRMDRIDENVKNAEIKPCVRNGHKYITESQLYDLMLEMRTDKCRAFRKWLTNEVLPALNHKGTYSVNEGKQLTLPEKPYEYFDKTWNGEPVLTSEDFAHLTGLYRSVVSHHFRNHDFTLGVDFYLLNGKDSAKFRVENPRMPRNSSHLYLITASGFRKLCKYVGVEVEEPKIFIEMKKEEKPACNPIEFIPKKYHEHLEDIRFELEAIKQMTYLLDIPKGRMIDRETRFMYQQAIQSRIKGMQNLCSSLDFAVCMIAKDRA